MSLPFLFGAVFTADRGRTVVLGYVAYLAGGRIFAFLHALLLGSFAGLAAWSLAGLSLWLGALHGVELVTPVLSALPFRHPRLTTDCDGPHSLGLIEPPGPFGLNYGRATPAVTIPAQAAYGGILARIRAGAPRGMSGTRRRVAISRRPVPAQSSPGSRPPVSSARTFPER